MSIIGYARVSTAEQNPQLQEHALRQAGAFKVFTDHISGTTRERPQLTACLEYLRDHEGDVLMVWKLDRLGRNTRHVLELIETLTERGIGFRSLTDGLATEGPMGRAMLTILAAFAQLERDLIVERTNAGLAEARRHGRVGGRPTVMDADRIDLAHTLRAKGKSLDTIADVLNVSRSSVRRALQRTQVPQ